MADTPLTPHGRAARVRKNLRLGMQLAWAASPRALIRYSVLGIVSAAMPPIAVLLGAMLVNRIADARLHALRLTDLLPIVIGLWVVTASQRTIGAYMGYGRNLFVRRVQLEAERRLLAKASKVDIGHFDNSDWHDRLARAKRDVSWRPGDLTWSVLGLSGNIVTIVLMATLLASLHWVLVFLALAAAAISLLLERGVTARLYEFFYKETPEEREREYLGDLLVQPRSTKEIRAYVLADYLLGRHQTLSEDLFSQRVQMYRSATRVSLLTGLVSGTTLALAYLFVAVQGAARPDQPGRRRAGDWRVHVRRRHARHRSRARSSRSISTRRFSKTTSRSWLSSRWCPRRPCRTRSRAVTIDHVEFDDVTFTYPGGTRAGRGRVEPAHPQTAS